MKTNCNVLFLSDSWPHANAFGGQLRALQTARALQHVGQLSFVVVSSDYLDDATTGRVGEKFDVKLHLVPELSPNEGVVQKLRWLLDPRYLNVHGVVTPTSDRARILSLMAEADLVWVLNARIPNILQIWHWPHSHLDFSDVPSTYLRSVGRRGGDRRERWKATVQQTFAKRRELLFRERFTTLSVCSEADRNYLGGGDRIHVIPNGFERPAQEPVRDPSTNPPRIGFMGLYSYAPNLEGVRWFLQNCWPAIRREVPGIRFRLAGKDTDGALRPNEPDVDVLGWLADAASEIATWSAMIIPIRLGGGTRVKIADAFSRKCPVVSTQLGAFGYDVLDGRELRVVDDNDPQAFASKCISLIRDPVSANAMAERAFHAFLEKWTWDAIAPKVWAAAEDCLRRSERNCYRGRNPVSLRSNGPQP